MMHGSEWCAKLGDCFAIERPTLAKWVRQDEVRGVLPWSWIAPRPSDKGQFSLLARNLMARSNSLLILRFAGARGASLVWTRERLDMPTRDASCRALC